MLVLLIAGSIGVVIVIEVLVGRAEGRKFIVRYSEPLDGGESGRGTEQGR